MPKCDYCDKKAKYTDLSILAGQQKLCEEHKHLAIGGLHTIPDEQKENEVKITIYQTKCKLCGTKITSSDKQTCHDLLAEHLDDDCKMAQKMRSWELAGIYPQMMDLLRQEGLIELIRKKILKHYSLDEARTALEHIEME